MQVVSRAVGVRNQHQAAFAAAFEGSGQRRHVESLWRVSLMWRSTHSLLDVTRGTQLRLRCTSVICFGHSPCRSSRALLFPFCRSCISVLVGLAGPRGWKQQLASICCGSWKKDCNGAAGTTAISFCFRQICSP